jgi:hypothetical protein
MQSTFEEAAQSFSDGSIDLLHIDGFHTYEAVRNDYETWLPKMSERGVILFHDTNVHQEDFGVWRLWDELKTKYPHFEMKHGYGLGLIAVGSEPPSELASLFAASGDELEAIRDLFYQLGLRIEVAWEFELVKDQGTEEERLKNEREQRLRSTHPVLMRTSNFLENCADKGVAATLRSGWNKARETLARSSRNGHLPQ